MAELGVAARKLPGRGQDEWLVASRRYLSAESLKAVQAAIIEQKEVVPELAAPS